METDDLKRALALLDQRLDRMELVQTGQARKGRLDDGLAALSRGQTWTILWGVVMCLLGVAAWRGSLHNAPGAFISGIVIHMFGALTIAAGAVIKALVARIDYSEPVIALQRRVAGVQRAYVVAGIVVGLPWWFLWVPFLIVLFKAFLGVDFSAADPMLMLELTGFGVLGMVATWLVYHWAKIAGLTGVSRWIERAFRGEHLTRAQGRIDAIAAFERG